MTRVELTELARQDLERLIRTRELPAQTYAHVRATRARAVRQATDGMGYAVALAAAAAAPCDSALRSSCGAARA